MKKNNKKDMQVVTVHKWQKALDNSIKTMRFLWRHAIALGMLGMMIKVVDLQTANWRNILISLVIAGLVDFFKMKIKIKFSGQHHNAMFKDQGKHLSWFTDPTAFGSPAWNANPSLPGTPAYSISQNSRYD